MKRLFYFAFGSNMFNKRINERIGRIQPAGTFILPGYRLVFNCGNPWCSYANIVADSQASVEGVLYSLNDEQIHTLDMYEGYPRNYQKRYFDLPNGDLGFAYVSENHEMYTAARPQLSYINMLIDGAFQNNLLNTYNMLVEFKERNYKLRGSKHKRISLI
jgi:gamma-glutamylcyclotransferase (GGCT)/AIG2-like uncharacterized protein YtfP